jgi:hypothetical protein
MAKEKGFDPRLAHLVGDPRRGRMAAQDEQDEAAKKADADAKAYAEGSQKAFKFDAAKCLKVYIPLAQKTFYAYDSRDPDALERFWCPGPSNMGLHFPKAFEELDPVLVNGRVVIPQDGVDHVCHEKKLIAIHTMLDVIGTGVMWQIVRKPVWWNCWFEENKK